MSHSPEIAGRIACLLAGIGGIRPGKMFGLPAHYIGRRLFVCVYEQGIALKLPLKRVQELIDTGHCQPFRPLGKAIMRNWTWRPLTESFDPQAEKPLLLESAAHVRALEQSGTANSPAKRRQPAPRT